MNYDMGDVIRARTWDLLNPDGSPSEDIYVLLGALGVFGKPLIQQRDALRLWLASPAAIPAPPKLRAAVHVFLQ